jgi:single-strand DNA-binding protein
MNKVILIGRLTADPDIKNSTDNQNTVARYRLAVDRRFKKEGQPDADFIPCVTFGKSAEFAEKYLKKGKKIAVVGRIQTGSYDKDGQTIFTTDVVVEEHEFCESKASEGSATPSDPSLPMPDGFGTDDDLPFN